MATTKLITWPRSQALPLHTKVRRDMREVLRIVFMHAKEVKKGEVSLGARL